VNNCYKKRVQILSNHNHITKVYITILQLFILFMNGGKKVKGTIIGSSLFSHLECSRYYQQGHANSKTLCKQNRPFLNRLFWLTRLRSTILKVQYPYRPLLRPLHATPFAAVTGLSAGWDWCLTAGKTGYSISTGFFGQLHTFHSLKKHSKKCNITVGSYKLFF